MWQQLLLSPAEAGAVVLATTGMYWTLVALDRTLMADVRGAEHLPEELFDPGR